jgi:hypothetical protein
MADENHSLCDSCRYSFWEDHTQSLQCSAPVIEGKPVKPVFFALPAVLVINCNYYDREPGSDDWL